MVQRPTKNIVPKEPPKVLLRTDERVPQSTLIAVYEAVHKLYGSAQLFERNTLFAFFRRHSGTRSERLNSKQIACLQRVGLMDRDGVTSHDVRMCLNALKGRPQDLAPYVHWTIAMKVEKIM